MTDLKRIQLQGTGLVVRGDDIDTDRVIPARFLKCITFDEVGHHVFEDDRIQLRELGQLHSFDDPTRQSAQALIVNKNFGCGSSREHAAQALKRWNDGIRFIVGESFAEIFFGNCLAIGIPCLIAGHADIAALMDACERDASVTIAADLAAMTVRYGQSTIKATMAEGPRSQLLEGRWDATFDLLESRAAIVEKARSLSYFQFWRD
jgi:3-isopropylmalate/(R)-2-methylmalate dehydratase small subunit